MPVKPALSLEEKQFIQKKCLVMSDLAMAKELGRDIRTIITQRKKCGVNKKGHGKLQTDQQLIKKDHYNEKGLVASRSMDEKTRVAFFKTQLINGAFYETLKTQFTTGEMDYYLEEWGTLCVQFEDIVATEKRQIDEYIKAEIIGNRILRNVKITEDEILNLQKEVNAYRGSHNMEQEKAQERDNQLMLMIKMMSAQSGGMSNDYQKNVDLKNKLLAQLNARREDRVDQIKKQGTTFMGLVGLLREKSARESIGRHMELVRMAKEKKKDEWHKPIVFEDGQRDCILVDDQSQFIEEQALRLEDMGSQMMNKYKNGGFNILIVENDNRRIQFFQDNLPNNKIEFASSFMKAEEFLNKNIFDLICLDYDIGLDKKGSEVAKYIKEKGLASDILVHSENKEGAEEIGEILKDKTNVEIISFGDIIRTTIKESKE